MKIKLILSSLAFIFIQTQSRGQCITNTNNIFSFTYNQSYYEIVKENKSWTDANNCAKSRGGHLAIIDSLSEQDTIFSSLNSAGITNSNTVAPDGGGAAYVWIGGTDSLTEGAWVWDSIGSNNPQFWSGCRNGTAIGNRYNNWGNEPDNFQNQDGLGLALSSWPFGTSGEWNDIDLSNTLYFVIEHQLPVGIEELELKSSNLNLYPNPTSDWINIDCDCNLKNERNFFLYNSAGAKVIESTMRQNRVNLQNLKPGVYWFVLEGTNEAIPVQKK